MCIMVKALAVCKIIEILVIKYQVENPKTQISFSIYFLSNNDGLLYLVIKNIFLILIIGFALYLINVPNRKLYTVIFCKLLRLVLTFLLPLSNNFQLSLPSLYNLLPNLREAITALQLALKSLMVSRTLDPLYYTPAEIAATNKAIAIAMSKFVAKVTDNKKELLRYYAINLLNDLEPL